MALKPASLVQNMCSGLRWAAIMTQLFRNICFELKYDRGCTCCRAWPPSSPSLDVHLSMVTGPGHAHPQDACDRLKYTCKTQKWACTQLCSCPSLQGWQVGHMTDKVVLAPVASPQPEVYRRIQKYLLEHCQLLILSCRVYLTHCTECLRRSSDLCGKPDPTNAQLASGNNKRTGEQTLPWLLLTGGVL